MNVNNLLHSPLVRSGEGLLARIAAVLLGLTMMVVGLGMGVTMVMLPVGLVIGLVGVAILVGGLFAHITAES